MKKILPLIFFISTGICQTNEPVLSTEKSKIILNFVRNSSNEIVVKLEGHSQPIEIYFEGEKVGTLYEQDNAANLSQFDFEKKLFKDTSSGQESNIDPVTSPPNAQLTTPF